MAPAPFSGRRRLATVLTAAGLATLVAAGTVLAGTPVTNGYRDHAYGGGAARPNSDKPQSKTWYTQDNQWWAGMFWFTSSPPRSENRIWRLSADKSTWTPTSTVVDARDASHADYYYDTATSTLWVASVPNPNQSSPFAVPGTPDDIRIFRYTYSAGTWTQVGGIHSIPGTASAAPATRGGAWTVTIDRDSSGRLWAAWPRGGQIKYSYSDDLGTTWAAPAQVPVQADNSVMEGTLTHSDTVSVIAFGSRVGFAWSDQDASEAADSVQGNGFWFAHAAAPVADPTAAGSWTLERLPTLNQAGQNQIADNHINIKDTSDGRLFMVGKTGRDTINCATGQTHPLVEVFRRTTAGVWTAHLAGTVGDCNTRPQIAISEQLETAYVFATSPNGGGTVYMKSAPISGTGAMVFRGAADTTVQRGIPFIRSATETLIDDASTTKQLVTSATGIVVNANNLTSAAGGNAKVFLHNYMPLPASDNTAPTGTVSINAGAVGTNTTAVSVAVPAADNAGGSGMSLVRLSNASNMSGAVTYIYTSPIPWTLSAGEGTKTVYVEWRDAAGNWSATANDTIELDNSGPTGGSVVINDGDAMTDSILVDLDLSATDASGVASVLIANEVDSFTGVTPVPYAPTVQHQLASGIGTRTVFVRFVDTAGNVSATSVSDSITVQSSDVTPPNPVTAVSHIVYGVGQSSFPVRISWTGGSDNPGGSGVAGYVIQRQVNGGAFTTVATVNHPTLTYQANLSTSSATYRYRVLVKDAGRGLTSSGKYTPTFRTLSYSESSSSVKYTGAWSTTSSSIYVGGKAKWGQAANASASLTFTGNRIGWLSRTGPIYGTARVYINGSLASTVNLFSATYTDKRIVFQRSFTSSTARTIRVVVSGTAGHPRVTLDQFFVLR
jgi:hypothetical protein